MRKMANIFKTAALTILFAAFSLCVSSCFIQQNNVYYSCGIFDWNGDEDAIETAGNYLYGKGAAFGTIAFSDIEGETAREICDNADAQAKVRFSALALTFDVEELSELLKDCEEPVSFTYGWARTQEYVEGTEIVYVGKWHYPSGTIE